MYFIDLIGCGEEWLTSLGLQLKRDHAQTRMCLCSSQIHVTAALYSIASVFFILKSITLVQFIQSLNWLIIQYMTPKHIPVYLVSFSKLLQVQTLGCTKYACNDVSFREILRI